MVARHGHHQYLTASSMDTGAGGDSGGAVWIRDNSAHIVGIWLGSIELPAGTVLGRFHGLVDAFGFEAGELNRSRKDSSLNTDVRVGWNRCRNWGVGRVGPGLPQGSDRASHCDTFAAEEQIDKRGNCF